MLRRQNPKPKLDWADRIVLAALARRPPRPLRMSRLMIPETLPQRWHPPASYLQPPQIRPLVTQPCGGDRL